MSLQPPEQNVVRLAAPNTITAQDSEFNSFGVGSPSIGTTDTHRQVIKEETDILPQA